MIQAVSAEKPTLGIYGIQDRNDFPHPQYVHDHNLALMEKGQVKNFVQLERLTRRKRDNLLHHHLEEIVRDMQLIKYEPDVVFVDNVVGRAFISTKGQIRFEAPLNKRLTKSWEEGRLWWFDREVPGYVLSHELAHIFSCLPFFGEFEDNSLLVHFDGGASLSNFSAWMYRMGKIIPVEHHWELKTMTSLFNANALTFSIIGARLQDQNSVSGKLMGYSALGSYNEEIEFWLRQNKWFENIWAKKSAFLERAKSDFSVELKSFDQHNTFLQDVVATIQEVFMRETLMKIDDVNSLSRCKNLYYTGGCALNIKSNSALLESELFTNIYIPPCTEDSGLGLGAAAFGEWMKGNQVKKHSAFLNNHALSEISESHDHNTLVETAKLLAEGKVVGTIIGNGEAGPRALGNRSLLAIPSQTMAWKVSVDLKEREWYRPVAPVMLEKNARYFTGKKEIHRLSEYMLLDYKIESDKISEIEGVVHADGTARIQSIFSREQHPFLFDLLSLLDEQYGIKALINTSFNGKNEPLVHTVEDGLRSGKKMGVDALVFDGKLHRL